MFQQKMEEKMFKKTCVQRISAIITAVGMVVSLTSYNIAKASEIEINKVNDDNALVGYETNANNLVDDYDEDSELCQKLELDYENSITDLSEEREKELNEIGVFDSDIEAWDDDMIEKINNAYAYSMSVMYYGENHEDGTLEELTAEETDEVIEDVYGEELEETKEEKENILEQALENTVFGAVKAKAKSYSDTKIQSVDSGKIKQILACIQKTKGGDINVIYSNLWLVRPFHVKTDVAGVSLKNATPLSGTAKAYYKYEYMFSDFGKWQKPEKPRYTDKIKQSGFGVAAEFEFMYSSPKLEFRNDLFIIDFDCKIDDKKKRTGICATGNYCHCTAKRTVSPGICIGVDSISVSVSGSYSDVYKTVLPNPMVNFFPK